MKEGKYFNIRVYGIIINGYSELLVAEEYHYNTFMRKFPGGGLQFGEGIKDCLIRELMEELNIKVEPQNLVHFHTTDFFVQSAFNKDHQVIGIYFIVKLNTALNDLYREVKGRPSLNGEENFKWMQIDQLEELQFTFPVDKQVVKMLLLKKEQGQLLNF